MSIISVEDVLSAAAVLDKKSELDRSTVWLASMITQVNMLNCLQHVEEHLCDIKDQLGTLQRTLDRKNA